MNDIPDCSIDMVLCDLPYGTTHNKWDAVIPFDILWEQYDRIVKETTPVVLFAQGLFYADLVESNRKNFRYDLVWNKVLKTGFLNANVMPLRVHEQIAVFYKSKPIYNPQKTKGNPNHSKGSAVFEKGMTNNNYGKYVPVECDTDNDMKYPDSILTFSKQHPSVSVHPTQKPVELLEYLIKTYTNEGDTVLDNTMGCGSTGVACVNTNRNFIGIEKDEKYFSMAEKRINQSLSEKERSLF
jgi:site-specific DNA-methyltransferase (adenine-specific)